MNEIQNHLPSVDTLGYFPVVGQVVGATRVVYGVVATIVALAMVILSNKPQYWEQKLYASVAHIARGTVELIPVIGGILLYIYDHDIPPNDIPPNDPNPRKRKPMNQFKKTMLKNLIQENEYKMDDKTGTIHVDALHRISSDQALVRKINCKKFENLRNSLD